MRKGKSREKYGFYYFFIGLKFYILVKGMRNFKCVFELNFMLRDNMLKVLYLWGKGYWILFLLVLFVKKLVVFLRVVV